MDEDGMVPSTAVPFARDYAFPPLDGVASNLSDGMFIGAIRGQMSPEQQAKWLPLAQSHQILGTCECSRSLCAFFRSLRAAAAQTLRPRWATAPTSAGSRRPPPSTLRRTST